jgi:hypothetical protein
MKHLIEEPESSVILAKKGQGRLYYRIAVEYSPKVRRILFIFNFFCVLKFVFRTFSCHLEIAVSRSPVPTSQFWTQMYACERNREEERE